MKSTRYAIVAPGYEPSQRRAGARRADRATTIGRIARLLEADADLPLEDAFSFVTGGMVLGALRKHVEAELANAGRAEP